MTSDFSFDDLNQFIELVDEVYELAKLRELVENGEVGREGLAGRLLARKDSTKYKQVLLLLA
ncbi:MAG: hypothetical protein EAX96_01175 [Candidatus Lokiarchaeota archaeon]|nr:hypothetical protein [Candidatus Lokiarchaeota archaeon]